MKQLTTCLLIAAALGMAFGARAQAPAEAVVVREFVADEMPTPSCHASTIVEAGDGLVCAWFGGKAEGDKSVGIWLARFDGKNWSKPVEVANGDQADGVRYPSWNPVLFQPKAGPLMLFYKVGPRPKSWWGMLMTSKDGGATWSKGEKLPDGILGPIKNKPVELAGGTILCPTSTEHDGWRLHMEWTRDLGRTWDKSGPLNDGKTFGAIQPSILRLDDSTLGLVCRSQQGRVLFAKSKDAGQTWGELKALEAKNPNSGIDAMTLADGRHVMVYNDTDRGRSPLNVAVSKDGETWENALTLEDERGGEFSYPAVIQAKDGKIHVTYTWKRLKVRHVVIDGGKLKGA
jgi:predicted neuraminidase